MGEERGAAVPIPSDLSAVLDAQKNAILAAVDSQIQGLQSNLLQAQTVLAVQLASDIQDIQPDTYTFKRKGNEQQSVFNRKVIKTSNTALKPWRAVTYPKQRRNSRQ
ncbi:hypothetical protein OS493_019664, partial [Desmophyllum pertusum]